MLWLKACPRCRGDLMLVSYGGDSMVNCLQCGHMLADPQVAQLADRARRARRPRVRQRVGQARMGERDHHVAA